MKSWTLSPTGPSGPQGALLLVVRMDDKKSKNSQVLGVLAVSLLRIASEAVVPLFKRVCEIMY